MENTLHQLIYPVELTNIIFEHLFSQLSLREIVKYYGNDTTLWKYFVNQQNANELLMLADEYQLYPLILKLLEFDTLYSNNDDWLFQKSAFFGDIDRISSLLQKGTINDFNTPMISASKGGQLNIMEFIFQNTQKYFFSWTDILNSALELSRPDMIEFVENNGRNFFYDIQYAAKSGNMEMVNMVIQKGFIDWNSGLLGGASGGHLHIIDYFKSNSSNFNGAVILAAQNGHLFIINYLIENAPENYLFHWNTAMTEAGGNGHLEVVEFMMSKGADDFNGTLLSAVRGGHMNVIEFMINQGADEFNSCIIYARISGRDSLIPFFTGLLQLSMIY